jgi:3-oxoacyl-[acyl-carrier-protein] synthase-3
LALDVAASEGRLLPGRLVAVNALGGGFAWGASLLRW